MLSHQSTIHTDPSWAWWSLDDSWCFPHVLPPPTRWCQGSQKWTPAAAVARWLLMALSQRGYLRIYHVYINLSIGYIWIHVCIYIYTHMIYVYIYIYINTYTIHTWFCLKIMIPPDYHLDIGRIRSSTIYLYGYWYGFVWLWLKTLGLRTSHLWGCKEDMSYVVVSK